MPDAVLAVFTNYIRDRFLVVRLRRCRSAIACYRVSRDFSLWLLGLANEVGVNCGQ